MEIRNISLGRFPQAVRVYCTWSFHVLNLPINLFLGDVLVAVLVVVCLSSLMSCGRLPFQWASWGRNVLRQVKYLMSVIMCPQKQFTLRYFANALRGELNTPACRLSFEDHLPIWYLIYYTILTDMCILNATILESRTSSISHRFCWWTRTWRFPQYITIEGIYLEYPQLNVLQWNSPCNCPGEGRVLQISSDRNDRMGAKTKTPKYPWTKI